MKKFNNKFLIIKWAKLILSIYHDDYFYFKLREENNIISKYDKINILNNQIKLLKMRNENFKEITKNKFENFKYLEIIL